MLLLEGPYVSRFLERTARENAFSVLENSFTKGLGLSLLSPAAAIENFRGVANPALLTNSENAIDWVIKNLPETELPFKINIFKNKTRFRRLLKKIYPDFYFNEVLLEDLKNIDVRDMRFPFVIKPSIGFLSLGVYTIKTLTDFQLFLKNIDGEIEKIKGFFPVEVMDVRKFIIEEYIEGEEYAADVYFDKNGEPVILNIFKHPFLNEADVKDRVYVTSRAIIRENIEAFKALLNSIGEIAQLKSFPMHIELRKNKNGLIPIEVNPLRFAGWCTADIAYYAYGINVYEYFFRNRRPHWDEILKEKQEQMFYFTMAEVPAGTEREKINGFDKEKFLANIAFPLEARVYDYKTSPLFATVFAETKDYSEIEKLLALDMKDFIF